MTDPLSGKGALMLNMQALGSWADQRFTDVEVAVAIQDIVSGDLDEMQRVWESPTDEEKDQVSLALPVGVWRWGNLRLDIDGE